MRRGIMESSAPISWLKGVSVWCLFAAASARSPDLRPWQHLTWSVLLERDGQPDKIMRLRKPNLSGSSP